MLDFVRGLMGNEFDRLLKRHAKCGNRRFLVVWNRGLGDIALGMYALVQRIRTFIPDSSITFITRAELEEGFRLLDGVGVIAVPWWQRGVKSDLCDTMKGIGIDKADYDAIIENVNPTKWLSWQIGAAAPKLVWRDECNELYKRFGLGESGNYIGAHVSSETGRFYKTQKDWPAENWKALFDRLASGAGPGIILFGHQRSGEYESSGIIDLRGETSLFEMLSIIRNCCSVLVAPDGGVLSIVYYLNTFFPIRVVSLWGDSHQGVLKQGVASPNPGLEHIPLLGRDNNISNITIEEVMSSIKGHNRGLDNAGP
jgi:ADP-heptose:LPS heptosyltransferase